MRVPLLLCRQHPRTCLVSSGCQQHLALRVHTVHAVVCGMAGQAFTPSVAHKSLCSAAGQNTPRSQSQGTVACPLTAVSARHTRKYFLHLCQSVDAKLGQPSILQNPSGRLVALRPGVFNLTCCDSFNDCLQSDKRTVYCTPRLPLSLPQALPCSCSLPRSLLGGARHRDNNL